LHQNWHDFLHIYESRKHCTAKGTDKEEDMDGKKRKSTVGEAGMVFCLFLFQSCVCEGRMGRGLGSPLCIPDVGKRGTRDSFRLRCCHIRKSKYALILPSAIAFPIVIALRAEQEKERVSWRHVISQVLSHALSPHTYDEIASAPRFFALS